MRAMPSPVERTIPVSRTSSCLAYSLICSRMMSLISAARICIAVFSPPRGLGAALGHPLRQALELGLHAAIVHGPAHVERDTAQELGVDLRGGENLPPPREATRQLDELVLLGDAERRSRSD